MSIKNISNNQLRIISYSVIALLSVIQAYNTPFIFDEGYYWVGSKNMDWGHFYYPPLIDIFTQIGDWISSSRLGIRFPYIVLQILSFVVLEKLMLVKNTKNYFAIIYSIIFIQVAGILVAPDILLFFLSLCFVYYFKQLLTQDNVLRHSIILGIISALMLYTKYHGILIIAFFFLYNLPKYYKNKWFYLWPIVAIICFLPHLWWQYIHDFPTIRFHLYQRPGNELFSARNMGDYIPGQLLFAGPLVGILMFYAVIRYKVSNQYDKTLKYFLCFFYLFWFLISMNSHIEINWGLLGLIPLIILSHRYISEHVNPTKILRRIIFPVSVIFMLVLRSFLLNPEWAKGSDIEYQLSGWEAFSKKVHTIADGRPVVFLGPYQDVSIYSIMTKSDDIYTFSSSQRNDYILYFPYEERVQGKTVVLMTNNGYISICESDKQKFHFKFDWCWREVVNFRSYNKIQLVEEKREAGVHYLKIEHPYPYEITFKENLDFPSEIILKVWEKDKNIPRHIVIGDAQDFLAVRPVKIDSILSDITEGIHYQYYIQTGYLEPMPCSRIYNINQEK